MYRDYNTESTTVTDVSAINNSIRNILTTRRGSLPGKPTFGSDIHRLVFEQLDHVTENVLQRMIRDSIKEFEPRIIIVNIELKSIPEFNRLVANITYRYRENAEVLENTTTIDISQ